mgnify:CR=1 FL=1
MCKVAIICGSKALALKRSRLVIYHPMRWDLAGGAADSGETIEEAASRESLEEAGVAIDTNKLNLINTQSKLIDGEPTHRFCFSYIVKEEFEPKLSFEHSGFEWVDIKELDKIDLPDFYKDCIRKVI